MISEEQKKRIDSKYLELITVCKPVIKTGDLKAINKAFEIAFTIENENEEIADELNICHAIDVATFAVSKIGLGTTSIICALLHHIIRKTDYPISEISKHFGDSVVKICIEYSKISELQTKQISLQSDKFRNLFLSFIDDIRVILIKMAHRLHDMHVIDTYSESKQKKICNELTFLFIPIAHRLGLYKIKTEMEDLLMKYYHPDIYNEISLKLDATKSKRKVFIEDFSKPIQRELIKVGFDCEIKGRPKSIHSIWTKMKKQNVELEEVYDHLAVRIIINTKKSKEKSDCWRVYSIVTDIYQPNPKRLRDWISTPKASGYESLHTTVKCQNNRWIEVQIRTTRMDELAEKGIAAHWDYKSFSSKNESNEYLNQIRDILENPSQIEFELDDSSKINKKSDKVFIFTPNGDLKQLPAGSTILDFAYEVHTKVGSTCRGAKVNNKAVPIRYVLNNGDKVEIITNKNQKPKLDWLSFVVTNRAKSKIKRSIEEEKHIDVDRGKGIIKRKLKNWKIEFSDDSIDKLIKYYKLKSSLNLYSGIAQEKFDLQEIRDILTDKIQKRKSTSEEKPVVAVQSKKQQSSDEDDDFLLIDNQLKDVSYNFAKCCNPILGDAVFGFVTVNNGITIHRNKCPNAKRLHEQYEYRIISVKWKDSVENPSFQAVLKIVGRDRLGILDEITKIISDDLKVNMISLRVESKKKKFEGIIKVQVNGSKHFDELIHKLSKINDIDRVSRISKF
ncbi:MAG: RelA/SpoT family protein [Bacteroidales bacterium]|nr:RelA/SpoT family protein [Bacteroidales bacterium]